MKFSCPLCGGKIEGEAGWVGLQAECPHCGEQITIEDPPVRKLPPPPLPPEGKIGSTIETETNLNGEEKLLEGTAVLLKACSKAWTFSKNIFSRYHIMLTNLISKLPIPDRHRPTEAVSRIISIVILIVILLVVKSLFFGGSPEKYTNASSQSWNSSNPSMTVTCISCGGSGQAEASCSTCSGSGIITPGGKGSFGAHLRDQTGGPSLQSVCPTCGGIGKATKPCRNCGGRGNIVY